MNDGKGVEEGKELLVSYTRCRRRHREMAEHLENEGFKIEKTE